MDPALECDWHALWHSFVENLFFLPQQVSVVNSFLIPFEFFCQLSLLSAGVLSSLNMCRSYMCCHTSSVRSCVYHPCCFCFLGVTHHLWLLQSSCFLFTKFYWAQKRGLYKDISYMNSVPIHFDYHRIISRLPFIFLPPLLRYPPLQHLLCLPQSLKLLIPFCFDYYWEKTHICKYICMCIYSINITCQISFLYMI